VSEDVWSERDTTPSAIEAALRGLLVRRHQEERAFVPPRVMNLVVVVDASSAARSRTGSSASGATTRRGSCCARSSGRRKLDAWATIGTDDAPKPGHIAVGARARRAAIGEQHLAKLDTIVDPLLVTDLATMCWAPHGIPRRRRAAPAGQIVLSTRRTEPDVPAALARADLSDDAYVVDLAWLRSTPWRERVAAAVDPPRCARARRSTRSVVRHRPTPRGRRSVLGWLARGWAGARLALGSAAELPGRAARAAARSRCAARRRAGAPGLAA
jgi:hypothetical protein